MASKSKPVRRYLKIPYDILRRADISLVDKVVYAHIFGFGLRGCWASNASIGQAICVSPNTVSRSVVRLYKTGAIYVHNGESFYRTMWAVSHPAVADAMFLPYQHNNIGKHQAMYNGQKDSSLLHQNGEVACQNGGRLHQNGEVTSPNWCGNKKETTKELKKETTATSSPSPVKRATPSLRTIPKVRLSPAEEQRRKDEQKQRLRQQSPRPRFSDQTSQYGSVIED